MSKPRRKWKPEEKNLLFSILSKLKAQRNLEQYESSKDLSEDCKKTSKLLTEILGEPITPNQVEWQVVLLNTSTPYNKTKLKTLGYALINDYITVKEFNAHFLNKGSFYSGSK